MSELEKLEIAGVVPAISKTRLIQLIRRLPEYEEWKRAVFIRDRFACQECGARNGRKRIIEAHHLTELSSLVMTHNITSVEEAIGCPALWAVDLGQTLCHSCHEKTESYPKSFCKPKKRTKKL